MTDPALTAPVIERCLKAAGANAAQAVAPRLRRMKTVPAGVLPSSGGGASRSERFAAAHGGSLTAGAAGAWAEAGAGTPAPPSTRSAVATASRRRAGTLLTGERDRAVPSRFGTLSLTSAGVGA
jgi:hypothetical protein